MKSTPFSRRFAGRNLAFVALCLAAFIAVSPSPRQSAQAQSSRLTLDNWQRHVIDDARPTRAVFIAGGDLDGDGLPDVATGNSWYVNPGTPGAAWARREFGAPLNNMAALHDFDGDGKLDVLGNQGVGDEENPAMVWARNDGGGGFTLYDNIGTTSGNFLQGVSVNRYQAGSQLQVAISWQDWEAGTQLLTVPAVPTTGTWTWEVASSSAFGEDLSSADIDRDGDIDLMLGTQWLENTGAAWTTRAVGNPIPGGPDRNELVDINQDGRLDAVVGSSREGAPGLLIWYEQPENATDPWTAHVIAADVIGGGMSLDAADMDNDGDVDIILGEHDLNPGEQSTLRLIIFENVDGRGAGWAPHIVHTGDEHHDGTRVIDIDLDGDLDILSIGWSHSNVLLYENKAIDVRNPVTPEWLHLSSDDGAFPQLPASAEQTATQVLDVDKDGVNDFVIGSRNAPGPALIWYRRTDVGWEPYTIEAGTLPIEAGGAFHDIDGDGDLDLAFGGDFSSNEIWWWENPYPNFDPGVSWTRRVIKESGVNMHHDMIFGDFDANGRAELVFWNQQANQLISAEIPADPRNAGPWTLTPIYAYTGEDHEGLAAADIDLDGKPDLVGGGRWFKHVSGNSFSVNVVDDVQRPGRVAVGQLVPGGRPELVMVPGETVGPLKWYRWNGTAWIGADLLGVNVTNGHSLAIVDINRDGRLDIFVAEMRLDGDNDTAKMWLFYGDGAGNFSTEVIATGIGNHESRVADLDGDGDLDILGKPFNWDTPRLDLWLNVSGRLPVDQWRRHLLDDDRPWRAIFMTPGDVDGDKRPDIIAGAWWYRNPGRPDGTWTRNIIGAPLNNMAAVYDFDTDGALDIIGTGGQGADANNSFTWAHNDGAGNFTLYDNIDNGDGGFLQGTTVNRFSNGGPLEVVLSWQQNTPADSTGVQSLTVPADPRNQQWTWQRLSPLSQGEGLDSADMDRDGDQDIILGTQWLRNDPGGWTPFTLHNPDTGDPDRVHLVDMDQDGDLDAVIGYGHDPNGKLAWYEQPADITALWTEHLIANLVNPQSVSVADMDRDGDLDIVVGEHNLDRPDESRLFVYTNDDGRGGAWTAHLIQAGDEHHDAAQLVDIDGDGDLDIISTGWVQTRVLLYENLAVNGGNVNAPPQADAGTDQVLIDLDGDGEEVVQLDGSASTDDGGIVEYSWRVDGTEVALGAITQITLPVGEHELTLAVTDDQGVATVDTVTVAVWTREPVIVQPPQNAIVLQGYAAPFSVKATGAAPFTYQWQLDGVDIPGATAATYTLPTTTLDDTGRTLRVIVTNAYGTVTSTEARLRVLESRSDDFNSCTLNQALWTFHDPQADTPGASTVGVDGYRLILSVPGAVNHDVWTEGIQAPHLTLPMDDTDFAFEVKFSSPVNAGYQLQGVLVLEDDENFVRVNVQHDGNAAHLLGIRFASGTPTIAFNRELPSGAAPFFLRLTRAGDSWQAAYSYDGATWTSDGSLRFDHAINVRRAGLFAGNVGFTGPAPEVNMIVDYFVDTASPLTLEDGLVFAPDALNVTTVPAGAGEVSLAATGAGGCSETLILTAIPAPGWSFDRWEGDVVAGGENPVEGQFTVEDRVAAHFVQIEEYPLVINVVSDGNGAGGAVSREPDKTAYRAGEVVTLRAEAAPGWQFAGWSEDVDATAATVQVTVEQATRITAQFVQIQRYPVVSQTSGEGNGIVVVTPDQPDYAPGTRVTLQAIPAVGSVFTGWSGDATGTASTVEVVTDRALSITAHFESVIYTLSTAVEGQGEIVVSPNLETYAPGTLVVLHAIPAGGWRFEAWRGDGVGVVNPAAVVMDGDKTVQAVFVATGETGEEPVDRVYLPVIQ